MGRFVNLMLKIWNNMISYSFTRTFIFRAFLFFFLLGQSSVLFAQIDLNYYLPKNVTYNKKIPTPKEVIGHEVGEWHVSHDKLVRYMEVVAEASDRVTIKKFGETYERRPLVLLTITSPDNQKNIDQIKDQHKDLTNPSKSGGLNISNMPAVLYMGYSIHGNEPSGSNASLAVAYYLAAAEGERINEILKNVVILLDPSFNPDGLDRFASWANTRRSLVEVADPQNLEQNEPWPRGRTNHYWFDLNRDWLPAQLPESQARLRNFHEWKPNVLTDHHEMGTNSTFFFQPGIPSRNNPLTPENVYRLTEKMGEYHAKALDQIGSLYYTKESFDDYYFGKGSTYPDINGAIGILFEQASSRGHAQESVHGVLKFPFTVRNQFATTLSTINAVTDLREEFLKHQKDFYSEALREGQQDRAKAYVFGSQKDPLRAYHLAELINRHDIDIYKLNRDLSINGKSFTPEGHYIVPLNQAQYRLIKAMFETRTSFTDSLFYDISTWTLPLAFNLPYADVGGQYGSNLQGEKFDPVKPEGKFTEAVIPYAYIFEWYGYYSPKLLYKLQDAGLKAKVATEPFISAGKRFDRGSIVIPAIGQDIKPDSINKLLKKLTKETGIEVTTVASGLDYSTFSLGSPTFESLEKPKIALLVGDGVSSYEAGEVWHQLDIRYEIPVSRLSVEDFQRWDLSRYNTIIMVSGSYSSLSDKDKEKFKQWISAGGTLIAQRTALSWLSNQNIINLILKKSEKKDSLTQRRYIDINKYSGAQTTGGSIFNVKGDLTHPLLYGYTDEEFSTFRNHNIFMQASKNPFGNPLVYTSNPLQSGYISKENLQRLQNTAMAGTVSLGRGKIVALTDNTNFRAFWYGTNKLFANAIFFGPEIERGASR